MLPNPQNITQEQALIALLWPPYLLERSRVWGPEPVWIGTENLVPTLGFSNQTVISIVSHYTHCHRVSTHLQLINIIIII
jgi:hypothetical protein